MKIKRKDLIIYIFIGIIILAIFSVIIVLLSKNKVDDKIDLNKVSNNYNIDDNVVLSLFERFNPEDGLLFDLIGSNNSKDYYGYFYRKNKVKYNDLDSVVKNTVLINDFDYTKGQYDDNNSCYYIKKSDFHVIYDKIFGTNDYNFEFNDKYQIVVNVLDDSICVRTLDGSNYDKTIDTYVVNVINEDDYIKIYERVAFIKLDKKNLYFYKDYSMKDLVYKLKVNDDVDTSFINDSSIVSNVLLKYQDDFDLYEYVYKKGVDTYHFESIER